MIRRTFTGAFAGSLLAVGSGTVESHAAPVAGATGKPRIGRLSEGGPSLYFEVFRVAMSKLGHAEVVIEDRPAGGRYERLPELAAELVALEVDVIWTVGSVATKAVKEATRTIPIVMVSADAVGAGLVASLARPGGNLTGLTLIANEIVGKRLDLLKQLDPNIKRIIALAHGPGSADTPIVADWLRQTQSAASSLRLAFSFVEVPTADPKRWDDEFGLLAASPGAALSVMESPFFLENSGLIAGLALKHRLPTAFAFKQHVEVGGLLSYGLNQKALVERVAYYVSRILGGAKPGELPFERPTKYELTINLKTAKALGLKTSRLMLLRADHVIE